MNKALNTNVKTTTICNGKLSVSNIIMERKVNPKTAGYNFQHMDM